MKSNASTVAQAEANWKPQLAANLQELHLPAIRNGWQEAAQTAEREGLSHGRFLLDVTSRECQARHNNRVDRLRRESRLPAEKTLRTFDFKRLPQKAVWQAKALLDGDFLDRKENVLAFGKPGAGKTHLLCGIAHELVQSGRPVRFTTCALLVQELLLAKRELRLSRYIKQLSKNDGLLIDEMGYVQQSREEMEVLFTLLAERYERGSVLITSNLAFSQWEAIFKDPMTTAAAIDRLVHHSVIIELNIRSRRLEEAGLAQAQPTETATAAAEHAEHKEESIV